jgi:hypothetical protein
LVVEPVDGPPPVEKSPKAVDDDSSNRDPAKNEAIASALRA